MKISIITVVKNGANTIEDNIRSVESQNYKEWEHLIIDSMSSDGTAEIAFNASSSKRFCFSELDSGALEGMNKGISKSKGEIIGFLNADDVYYDECSLSKVAKAFAEPGVMACYGDLVYTSRDDLNSIARIWSMGEYSKSKLLWGWTAAHPTLYVRKSVFERIGKFNPNYKLQSDFEFVIRLFYLHQIKSLYIPERLVKMRLGGISNRSLKNIILQNISNMKALQEHGLKIGYFYPLCRIISRAGQYIKVRLNEK